jgi:uncharacterized protein YajQ (UPF0234 family)
LGLRSKAPDGSDSEIRALVIALFRILTVVIKVLSDFGSEFKVRAARAILVKQVFTRNVDPMTIEVRVHSLTGETLD